MKKLIFILFISSPVFASGPRFGPNYNSERTNLEFQNVYHDIKNPSIATGSASTMTVTYVKASTATIGALTSTVSTILKGTITNDSAAAGNVGEYITSYANAVNAATSNQYQDTTTISLTAGDWDVSGIWLVAGAGVTGTLIEWGLSIGTSGNAFSDSVAGDNRGDLTFAGFPGNATLIIPAWRVSIASTTTVRMKTLYTYTLGTPVTYGRISARRVR